MGINIPEHVKLAVIDVWIMGKTRDNIAAEFLLVQVRFLIL